MEELAKPLPFIYPQFWLLPELEVYQCDAQPQEGPKGGYRELQTHQADLCEWKDCGKNHLESHHLSHAEEPREQAQTAGVQERLILLDHYAQNTRPELKTTIYRELRDETKKSSPKFTLLDFLGNTDS